MDDALAKDHLLGGLRGVRGTMVWKLDGLSEHDVRRPLTPAGTNLLRLVKHLTEREARYFGQAFGRPFPERLPWWGDDDYEAFGDLWATADESRSDIVDRYRRACDHSDATIAALDLDSPGHVPWWPRPDVTLFGVMVHLLAETNRHAGHADLLREQLDGAVGTEADHTVLDAFDAEFWAARRAQIEEAAEAADPGRRP